MSEPRPTSSPNSILPPHSSHCDFIPTREHSASLSQMSQLHYLFFLKRVSVQLRNYKLCNSRTVYANTFKFKSIYCIYRHKYNFIPYLIHTLNNAIPTIVVKNAKLYWTLQRPRGSQDVQVDSNRTLRTPSHQSTVRSQLHIYPTTIRLIHNCLALMQLAMMLSTLLCS